MSWIVTTARARGERRQHVVRGVEEVEPVAQEPPREARQLGDRVAGRVLLDDLEVRRAAPAARRGPRRGRRRGSGTPAPPGGGRSPRGGCGCRSRCRSPSSLRASMPIARPARGSCGPPRGLGDGRGRVPRPPSSHGNCAARARPAAAGVCAERGVLERPLDLRARAPRCRAAGRRAPRRRRPRRARRRRGDDGRAAGHGLEHAAGRTPPRATGRRRPPPPGRARAPPRAAA